MIGGQEETQSDRPQISSPRPKPLFDKLRWRLPKWWPVFWLVFEGKPKEYQWSQGEAGFLPHTQVMHFRREPPAKGLVDMNQGNPMSFF